MANKVSNMDVTVDGANTHMSGALIRHVNAIPRRLRVYAASPTTRNGREKERTCPEGSLPLDEPARITKNVGSPSRLHERAFRCAV